MFDVTLDGFDEVRNEVVSSGQLDIDLCKPVSDAISFIDESVVNTDRPENYRGNYAQENQE